MRGLRKQNATREQAQVALRATAVISFSVKNKALRSVKCFLKSCAAYHAFVMYECFGDERLRVRLLNDCVGNLLCSSALETEDVVRTERKQSDRKCKHRIVNARTSQGKQLCDEDGCRSEWLRGAKPEAAREIMLLLIDQTLPTSASICLFTFDEFVRSLSPSTDAVWEPRR